MSRSKAHDQRNAAIREAFLRPFELAAASPPTGQTISVQAQMLNLDHSIEEVPGVGVYSVDSIDCVVLIYDPMKQKCMHAG
jgi:galactitol-specific phosphotransferase system IIC component